MCVHGLADMSELFWIVVLGDERTGACSRKKPKVVQQQDKLADLGMATLMKKKMTIESQLLSCLQVYYPVFQKKLGCLKV